MLHHLSLTVAQETDIERGQDLTTPCKRAPPCPLVHLQVPLSVITAQTVTEPLGDT